MTRSSTPLTAASLTAAALIAFAVTANASAAVVDGYTLSGADLDTITVDGVTRSAGDLINGTLTGYEDDNNTQLAVNTGGSVPAVRADVLSDLTLTTGLLNAKSVTFAFDQPVLNASDTSFDIVFFDWGAFSGDEYDVTINGVTTGFDPGDIAFTLATPRLDIDFFTSNESTAATSVADLEARTFPSGFGESNSATAVVGINLFDFGVPVGGSVTSITITDDDGTTSVDPMLILGVQPVPEPSSAAVVLAGLFGLTGRRRRL
ncbi:MAG: PEP-CTERM sorting domain-containing protein [Planctomycetota bacterium]